MNRPQPTDTVKAILSYRGILMKKHLQIGVIKGALTQDQADAKLADWLKGKVAKIQEKRNKLSESKQADLKARNAPETKVKEVRAEPIRKKAEVAAAAPAPAEAAAEGEAPAAEQA